MRKEEPQSNVISRRLRKVSLHRFLREFSDSCVLRRHRNAFSRDYNESFRKRSEDWTDLRVRPRLDCPSGYVRRFSDDSLNCWKKPSYAVYTLPFAKGAIVMLPAHPETFLLVLAAGLTHFRKKLWRRLVVTHARKSVIRPSWNVIKIHVESAILRI